nr:MarR family transcriptional regulator [Propionicimonas sp.]
MRSGRRSKGGEVRLDRFESAGFLTNLCARLFERSIADALRPLNLNPAYLPVVFMLADTGDACQTELAEALAVRQPTMAATLNRMERDGLVSHQQHPTDRRMRTYRLTPAAEGRLQELTELLANANASALAALSSDEQATYLQLSRIVAQTLSEITSTEDHL